VPYGIGLIGAGGLAYGAFRFSRRRGDDGGFAGGSDAPPSSSGVSADEDRLQDKLDEELDKVD